MKSLLEFKSIVEEEKSDYSKFDVLVRAGLANKAQMQRIHKILDKMGEDKPQFNNADRMIIQNLFNKMVDLISNNKSINMQARRAIKEDEDFIDAEQLDEANPGPTPPYVLLLKRKAIRLYPDGTKIALYYNKQINKYFSVPYDSPIDASIQAEEVVPESSETYKQGHAKFHTKTNKQIGPTHYGRGSDKKADSYTKADPRYHEVRPIKEQGVAEEVEITEAVMDQLHKIVNDKQAQSVKFASGHSRKIDHFTASALTQVHKALNDENKKKFADLVHKSPEHFMKASDFAFKHAK
jgi:hypothetical protein